MRDYEGLRRRAFADAFEVLRASNRANSVLWLKQGTFQGRRYRSRRPLAPAERVAERRESPASRPRRDHPSPNRYSLATRSGSFPVRPPQNDFNHIVPLRILINKLGHLVRFEDYEGLETRTPGYVPAAAGGAADRPPQLTEIPPDRTVPRWPLGGCRRRPLAARHVLLRRGGRRRVQDDRQRAELVTGLRRPV